MKNILTNEVSNAVQNAENIKSHTGIVNTLKLFKSRASSPNKLYSKDRLNPLKPTDET